MVSNVPSTNYLDKARNNDSTKRSYVPSYMTSQPNRDVVEIGPRRKPQKEFKPPKKSAPFDWKTPTIIGACILAGAAMIRGRARVSQIKEATSSAFDLTKLGFCKLTKDESIGDLRTTKTLSEKVQKFFTGMLDNSTVKEEYIIHAGLKQKGFSNAGLLLGPSGTGKTEAIKMYAKAKDANFCVIKLGDFANSYVDGTSTNMSKMFDEMDKLFKSKPNERFVILFDEADGIAQKLENISADRDYLNKNRQAFLIGCDKIFKNKNLEIFAATNVPLVQMDRAVISRFGKNIEFKLPTATQLKEGLKFHLRDCRGLKDGFYESKETSDFIDSLVRSKSSFRDLEKVTTDSQGIYARQMNAVDKICDYDLEYLKEALETKGKNAAEL